MCPRTLNTERRKHQTPHQKSLKKTFKCKPPQVVMGEIHGESLGDKLEVRLEDKPGGGECGGCSVIMQKKLALIPGKQLFLTPN